MAFANCLHFQPISPYFLGPGSSTGFMKTITRCELCNGEIEFDESQDGQEVSCPWCAAKTTLRLPPKATGFPVRKGAWDWLAEVRRNTCYKALRIVIGLGFALLYIALAIGFVASLTGLGFAGDFSGLAAAATILLVAVVAIAGHQATLLLIDIADVLIYDSARR